MDQEKLSAQTDEETAALQQAEVVSEEPAEQAEPVSEEPTEQAEIVGEEPTEQAETVGEEPTEQTKISDEEQAKRAAKTDKMTLRAVAFVTAIIFLFTTVSIVQNHESEMINITRRSKGITVEVVDARAANEFLYLTVNETYNKKWLTKAEEEGRYILPDLNYSGFLSAENVEDIAFDSHNFLCLKYQNSDYGDCDYHYQDRSVKIDDDWYEENKKFKVNAEYKIYLPDLRDFMINFYGKANCTLNVLSEKTGSNINMSFFVSKYKDVILSASRYMTNRVDVDELPFMFQEIQMCPSCVDILIGWNSPVDVDSYIPDAGASVEVYKEDEKEPIFVMDSCLRPEWIPEGYTGGLPTYVTADSRSFIVLSYYEPEEDLATCDIGIKVKDVHCDYSGLIKEKHEMKDIVLKSKKIGDEEYKVNAKLDLGDFQITLNSARLLHPDRDITSYYTYSYAEFGSSYKYTGKDELAHWRGYMDLVNPTTNETARFSISYYNMSKEEIGFYDVENGLSIQAYYLENPEKFIKELSQWHIASVTETRRLTRVNDEVSSNLYYPNRWVNPKFADADLHFISFRGNSNIFNEYVKYVAPEEEETDEADEAETEIDAANDAAA